MQLAGKQTADQPNCTRKIRSKSSDNLVFAVGKTNPLIFLNEFEKCDDTKTEKDKLFKIRNFVSEQDKTDFSTLYFKGDWPKARSNFLNKYSLPFTVNKKKDLSFTFREETSLRSFVDRKIKAMSTYTTLTLENQLEMILLELPNEVSNLFIINDKLKCKKQEILEFCEAIQEFVEDQSDGSVTPTGHSTSDAQDIVVQDLEIFNYEPDESEVDSVRGQQNRYTRGKAKGTRPVGRPRKILRNISVDSERSESDFIDSSQSSMSQF